MKLWFCEAVVVKKIKAKSIRESFHIAANTKEEAQQKAKLMFQLMNYVEVRGLRVHALEQLEGYNIELH